MFSDQPHFASHDAIVEYVLFINMHVSDTYFSSKGCFINFINQTKRVKRYSLYILGNKNIWVCLAFFCVKVTCKLLHKTAFWRLKEMSQTQTRKESLCSILIIHNSILSFDLLPCFFSELIFVYFNVFQPLLLGEKEKGHWVCFRIPLTSAQHSSWTVIYVFL